MGALWWERSVPVAQAPSVVRNFVENDPQMCRMTGLPQQVFARLSFSFHVADVSERSQQERCLKAGVKRHKGEANHAPREPNACLYRAQADNRDVRAIRILWRERER